MKQNSKECTGKTMVYATNFGLKNNMFQDYVAILKINVISYSLISVRCVPI